MVNYETIIGLEVHVQLATQSKAFCGDATAFGAQPNTHISPVSLAYPGTLPRANARHIELAVRLGLALGCQINSENAFDRKNYFYADLPKGYQITQDRAPICLGGALPVRVGQEWKSIRIHHIHMEEDAGKSIHTESPRHSLIDLNRAGVPLLEIVTEPELRSAAEVDAFMAGMRQLVRYLDVSDGNMEQGSLRCDINVSIRPQGEAKLRERCEIKNINSMRYARQAIAYEVERQIALMESGKQVQQQTLNFDPDTGRTSPLRDKEDAHDYRYFPEPDLPPVVLDNAYLERIRATLPALPRALYHQFMDEYGVSAYDAALLTEERDTAELFLSLCQKYDNAKGLANLIINRLFSWCQEQHIALRDLGVSAAQLVAFQQMIDEGKVSNSVAYQRVFPAWMDEPSQPPLAVAKKLNLIQTSDTDYLEPLAREILDTFPDKVAAYRKGKKGLLGFFMGQLMRASRGKADPKVGNKLLQELLEE